MLRVTAAIVLLTLLVLAVLGMGDDGVVGEADRLYAEGRFEESLRLYRMAADGGDASAMNKVGHHYHHGQGVEKNYVEAMRWYRKAAERGFGAAEYNIACFYYVGMGVKQDYVEAIRWYRKAADSGDVDGAEYVGVLHQRGHGMEQDHAEALRWFRKAAEAGDLSSRQQVGFYYYDGLGVERDLDAALHHHRAVYAQQPSGDTALRIWLCLEALGRGEEARQHLTDRPHGLITGDWFSKVLRFVTGDTTEEELLRMALFPPDEEQAERLCVAHFYIGAVALYSGLGADAARSFRKSVNTGASDHPAYRSASAELVRLQER